MCFYQDYMMSCSPACLLHQLASFFILATSLQGDSWCYFNVQWQEVRLYFNSLLHIYISLHFGCSITVLCKCLNFEDVMYITFWLSICCGLECKHWVCMNMTHHFLTFSCFVISVCKCHVCLNMTHHFLTCHALLLCNHSV